MAGDAADRTRSGDLAAFGELVARHQAMALGYALAILRDLDSAQDATQEAFVAAYFGLGSLDDRDKFPQWLRGIVRHQCWRILRRRELMTAPLDRAAVIPAHGATPEQWCVEQEAIERIVAAIDGLPAHLRPVATLYYLRDHAQREIATTLNLPRTTVNNRLHAARLLLRDWRTTMIDDLTNPGDHRSDDDTPSGTITRIDGLLVEMHFPAAARPRPLSALAAPGGSSAPIAVIQSDIAGRARGLVLGTDRPAVGAHLIATGQPIDRPASDEIVRAVIASGRAAEGAREPIETGIKALDLLCPIGRGGRIGIGGDMGVGKLVLLDELFRNTTERGANFTVIAFVQVGEEVAFLHSLDDELLPPAAGDRASYLVVDQPAILEPGAAATALDAVIYLTRDQAQRGFYPALDFARSSSKLLDPTVVGEEHYRLAREVAGLLAAHPEDTPGDAPIVARTRRLRRYLSQAFFVAAPFTGVPGEFVPLAGTIADCRAILRGEYDDVDERAFVRIGPVEQARARAAAL